MGWTIFMVATIYKRPAFVHINFLLTTFGDQAIFQKGANFSFFCVELLTTFTCLQFLTYSGTFTSSLEWILFAQNSCMLTISIVGSTKYIQFVGLIPQESRSLLSWDISFCTLLCVEIIYMGKMESLNPRRALFPWKNQSSNLTINGEPLCRSEKTQCNMKKNNTFSFMLNLNKSFATTISANITISMSLEKRFLLKH